MMAVSLRPPVRRELIAFQRMRTSSIAAELVAAATKHAHPLPSSALPESCGVGAPTWRVYPNCCARTTYHESTHRAAPKRAVDRVTDTTHSRLWRRRSQGPTSSPPPPFTWDSGACRCRGQRGRDQTHGSMDGVVSRRVRAAKSTGPCPSACHRHAPPLQPAAASRAAAWTRADTRPDHDTSTHGKLTPRRRSCRPLDGKEVQGHGQGGALAGQGSPWRNELLWRAFPLRAPPRRRRWTRRKSAQLSLPRSLCFNKPLPPPLRYIPSCTWVSLSRPTECGRD
jgi:hypothetical protein